MSREEKTGGEWIMKNFKEALWKIEKKKTFGVIIFFYLKTNEKLTFFLRLELAIDQH